MDPETAKGISGKTGEICIKISLVNSTESILISLFWKLYYGIYSVNIKKSWVNSIIFVLLCKSKIFKIKK